MASRYWVGGTDNWNATAGSKWATTSGGAGGAAVPGTGDDVFFDANSGANVITLAATGNCANFNCTGFAGTFAGSSTLNVRGNFTLVSGMTWSHTGTVTFAATASGKTITLAGKTLGGAVTANGSGGGWTLQDDFACSGAFTQSNGTWDTGSNRAMSVNGWVHIGGTFNANASTITTTGTGNIGINQSGGTLNEGTSSFVVNGGLAIFGAETFYNVTLQPTSATPTISGGGTFNNLTLTGFAGTSFFALDANITVNGTFAITGVNASSQRVLLQSDTRGVARTITAATVGTCTNCDFEDITGAGTGTWNLASITGKSGDGGGNSGITFTTPITCYWVADTGSVSDSSKWMTASGGATPARVPLLQDTARFDSASFTTGTRVVTFDTPRIGAIDWTGVTNTPKMTSSSAIAHYGNWTLDAGMTVTLSASRSYRNTMTINLAGATMSGNQTFDCGGQTVTLSADWNGGSTTFNTGTFDANDYNVTSTSFTCNSGLTREIYMGNGTWTPTSAATYWNFSSSGLTLHAENSTIAPSSTSASVKTFAGAGLTYHTLSLPGAASIGKTTISGSNSFDTLSIAADGVVEFTAGTTQTLTNVPAWVGTSGHVVTITSSSAGSPAIISCASGTASCDYMSLKDSTATGGATFYAGANSTNVSGNTGWTFSAPPSGSAEFQVFSGFM